MNRKQHTKVTEVSTTTGEILQVHSESFADSTIPVMTERRGYDYIPFGDRNDYPNYLLWLYNKSAKHNAIITGKCVYILGNGLKSDNEQGEQFLLKANENQSWDQLIKLMCLDIENFGGVYLQCIPKLAGGYNYYHVAYERLRTNEDNTCFYYKKEWKNNLQKAEKEYPAFRPGITTTSIFFYKEYRCGKNPYPLPTFIPACNWIESDIEVSRHTLTNAKTGFSASKFINFYNGEPSEEKKARITRGLENQATGAEGKKLLIAFNNATSAKPTIDDLGQSDLTKENFQQIDSLITSNIITGHNVTSGLLFAIQEPGKLGNSSELKTAFEIFKNTYINNKQKHIEEIVSYFSEVAGVIAEYKLKDVEPVGMDLDPVQFKELLPKKWILEKFGIDPNLYLDEINPGSTEPIALGNEALVNISGRQQQNLLRIVRLFSQGKLTKGQASIQLAAYGFTGNQINQYLGLDENPITNDQQFETDELEFIAEMFEDYGEPRENFTILKTTPYTGEDDNNFSFMYEAFADYTEREAKILELLKAQPDLSNAQIAEALKYQLNVVDDIVGKLVGQKIIVAEIVKGNTIRKITERLPKKQLPEIITTYTYEKRDDVPGDTLLKTSRPFCVRMVNISKQRMFSITDIQKLSERLGYSVFKRAGGFWNNNGTIEWHCRHQWKKHIVIKNK
jgi:hypothetical protein